MAISAIRKPLRLLGAANETLAIWGDELDFGELADDIAVEARLALALTAEIDELEERIAVMYRAFDPDAILRSVPGVGAINAAQILGRLGDPGRFRSLAGVRSFSGLVPSLDSSGQNGRHGGPTKSGDALLREALFMTCRCRTQDRSHLGPALSPADDGRREASQLGPLPHLGRPA